MNSIKKNFVPLTEKQIMYLSKISMEEKDDKLRGMRLLSQCSFHDLCINCTHYKDNEDITIVLEDLKDDYTDLAKKDLLKQEPNTFGCSYEELLERISKLKNVYELYMSRNIDDYKLCHMFITYYGNLNNFKKQYGLIIRNSSGDVRFDEITDALEHFDSLYNRFKYYVDNGYYEQVKAQIEQAEMRKDFVVASTIVSKYIESKNNISLPVFLRNCGITRSKFAYYTKVVQTLNPTLNEKLNELSVSKDDEIEKQNYERISAIYNGVTSGKTADGKDFDALELVKLLPYKECGDFYIKIKNLIRKPIVTCQNALQNESNPNAKEILLQEYVRICSECAPVYKTIVGALVEYGIANQFYFQEVGKEYYVNTKLSDPAEVDVAYRYLNYYQIPASYYTVQLVIDGLRGGQINVEELDALIKAKDEAEKKEKESYVRIKEVL